MDFFVDLILNHVFIKYNFLIELGFVFVDTEAEIVFDEELDEVAVLFDLFIAVDVDLLEELDCFFRSTRIIECFRQFFNNSLLLIVEHFPQTVICSLTQRNVEHFATCGC